MKIAQIKNALNALHLSDIYSLMLFLLYKVEDIPEYATLSHLCFLLDGNNLTRLLAYYAGQTIRIPTEQEFKQLTNALLLYQYVNLEDNSLSAAMARLTDLTQKEKDDILELYLKIIPLIKEFTINKETLPSAR